MRKKRGRSVQSPVAIPDYSPFQVATKDSGEKTQDWLVR